MSALNLCFLDIFCCCFLYLNLYPGGPHIRVPLVQVLRKQDMLILRVLYFAHLLALVVNKRSAGPECFSSKTATAVLYFLRNISHTPAHLDLYPFASVSIYCDYLSKNFLSPNVCCPKQISLVELCTLLLLSCDIATNAGPVIFGLCNIRSLRKNYATSLDFITSKA